MSAIQSSTRSAFSRFVTQPFARTAQPSARDHDPAKSAIGLPGNLRNAGINPLSSQDSSLKAPDGAEITSVDINRNRTHAVLAGKDVLQTVRVDSNECIEEENILATILSYDRQNNNLHRETLDVHDVKWSHGQYSNYIAAAATNGKVVIYDLGKPGIELARLHEHSRQVHKLAFSPFQGYLLLSASQDGTVRFWDLRDIRSEIVSWRSHAKYSGQSDGIRDVRWSPTDGVEFAFATDGGTVQKWDFRKQNTRLLRINAHDRICTAIDWHPDGKHLVSAGQDKNLKVWDMSAENRRSKPLWTVRTPFPIMNARWRHQPPSSDDSQRGPCTQIASSYERPYAAVHVWDLQQPYMPYREICNWPSAPTDMLWQTSRRLWTVHRDGEFFQTEVQNAAKVVDRRPMQALAVSPTGEICVFSQKRVRRRSSDVGLYDPISIPVDDADLFPERSEPSRSAADDPLDESFLSTSYKKHTRPQRGGSKSAASTPPSLQDPDLPKLMKLNENMVKKGGPLHRSQNSYRGFLEGTLNAPTFSYLSQKYKSIPKPLPSTDTILAIRKVFDQNAGYAQRTGSYRVAQTWRVFGALVAHGLVQEEFDRKKKEQNKGRVKVSLLNVDGRRLRDSPSDRETTSTPKRAPKLIGDGRLLQPNSASETAISKSPARPVASTPRNFGLLGSTPGTFNEPELYLSANDINTRKAQMSNWRATPRVPLDFNVPSSSFGTVSGSWLSKHNSGGSLSISASSGSQRSVGAVQDSYDGSNLRSVPESFDGELSEEFGLPETDLAVQDVAGPRVDDPKSHFSWLTSSSSGFGISMPFRSNPEDAFNLDASLTIIPDDAITAAADDPFDTGEKKDDVATRQVSQGIKQTDAITAQQMALGMLEYYTDQTPNAQLVYHLTNLLRSVSTASENGSKISPRVPGRSFPLGPEAINPLREESILSTYQEQLQSLQIYNASVALALEAVNDHEYLFDTANTQIGFICLGCLKPISNPMTKFRCENCGKRQAPCPICWQKYPAIEATKKSRKAAMRSSYMTHQPRLSNDYSVTTARLQTKESPELDADSSSAEPSSQTNHPILWQSCLVCGHGAHAACLQHVQNDPRIGGKCPTEGCLCDCIPGPYRTMLNREALDERARRDRGSVRRDSVRAHESKAVSRARGLLEGDGRRVRLVEPGKAG